MSLLSRTTYLASLAQKASERIGPLLDEFHNLKDVKSETVDELNAGIEELEVKINTATLVNNTELVKDLELEKENLINSITESLTDYMKISSDSIVEAIETGVKDIDGVKVSISMDVDNDILIPTIEPELLNMTTDFVKNTLTDSDTKVLVNSTVTGTAGPYTITNGKGSQQAPITTT